MNVATFKTRLLIISCCTSYSKSDSASVIVQASYLCLVCLEPHFTDFTLSPLLPLSCACCIFPFVSSAQLHSLPVLHPPPARQLHPHWVTEAEGKEVVFSRNCARFLKIFFLPRAMMVSLTSVALWSGLAAWAS